MSIDIVIPIRPEAPKNYIELRYALRSIEENFGALGEGECFLLGEKPPDWYRGGFVELAQPKELSAISGVIWKLKEFAKSYMEPTFLFSNDDIFILKPWSGARYFNKRRNPQSIYHNVTVERAQFVLNQNSINMVHDFELHVPVVYETSCLRVLLDVVDIKVPIALRTLYCNWFPTDSAGIQDCKVMNWMKPDMKWKFFSSDDQFAPRADFHQWLQQTFPKRSRWEK